MVATPFSLVGSIGGALGSLGSCQPGFTDLITLDLLMICCFSQEIHLRNRVLVVPGSSRIANPDTCFGGPGFSGELEVCFCS